MQALKKVILFTDTDGRARFRDEEVPLTEGTPQSRLSALMAASACQLRQSPVGFRSTFHCTGNPQWLFVLGGQMEIFLQDGSSRTFGPGEFFYSADTLPEGATFDATVHGHWSRQVGPDPLVTLFVRDLFLPPLGSKKEPACSGLCSWGRALISDRSRLGLRHHHCRRGCHRHRSHHRRDVGHCWPSCRCWCGSGLAGHWCARACGWASPGVQTAWF